MRQLLQLPVDVPMMTCITNRAFTTAQHNPGVAYGPQKYSNLCGPAHVSALHGLLTSPHPAVARPSSFRLSTGILIALCLTHSITPQHMHPLATPAEHGVRTGA